MLTPPPSAPTLRVAIYRASSLGDVVLATACLDLLERLPMPTEITWVGRGAALEVITQSWPEVRAIAVNRSDSVSALHKVVEQLAHNHLFIDLQCNLRSKWLAQNLKTLHGIPYFSAEKAQLKRNRLIVEARVRGRRRPLPERARAATKLQYEMMADALLRGLTWHLPVEMREGLGLGSVRPRLKIPDSFDPPWRKELRFGAWLGVAPGASHPTKQAPLEVVEQTLDKMKSGLAALGAKAPSPLGLVFFGDSNDRAAALKLCEGMNWAGPVLNLAGRLTLWETAVALRESTCLLSNDSSLGHIAEAVDTPTAILFGPTIEGFGFAPRMRQSRAFSTLLGCRPCSKHGKQDCRYADKLCFTAINIDEVATHLVGLLTAPDAHHLHRVALATRSSYVSTAGRHDQHP